MRVPVMDEDELSRAGVTSVRIAGEGWEGLQPVGGVWWDEDDQRALGRWLKQHGVDTTLVPAQTFLERRVEDRVVCFLRAVWDEENDRPAAGPLGMVMLMGVVHQLEAEPLPFPSELLARTYQWPGAVEIRSLVDVGPEGLAILPSV